MKLDDAPGKYDESRDTVPAVVEPGEVAIQAVTAAGGTLVSITGDGDARFTGIAGTRGDVRTRELAMASHPSARPIFCSDIELVSLTGVDRGGRVYVATIGGRHYIGRVDDVVIFRGKPEAIVLSELEADTWAPPTWTGNGKPPKIMRVTWHTIDRIEER